MATFSDHIQDNECVYLEPEQPKLFYSLGIPQVHVSNIITVHNQRNYVKQYIIWKSHDPSIDQQDCEDDILDIWWKSVE